MFSLGATLGAAQEQNAKLTRDYNVKPVPFNNVHVEDDLWTPRLEASRKVTIDLCYLCIGRSLDNRHPCSFTLLDDMILGDKGDELASQL